MMKPERTEKHGPHMTGPNADAAASCGDDTLSQNTSLKGGKQSAQINAGGQIYTQLVMRR